MLCLTCYLVTLSFKFLNNVSELGFFFFCLCVCVHLQRSRSAFSLTSDDSPEKGPEVQGAGAGVNLQDYASLKREGKAASLPSWKSVDRLDNSSMFQMILLKCDSSCCQTAATAFIFCLTASSFFFLLCVYAYLYLGA